MGVMSLESHDTLKNFFDECNNLKDAISLEEILFSQEKLLDLFWKRKKKTDKRELNEIIQNNNKKIRDRINGFAIFPNKSLLSIELSWVLSSKSIDPFIFLDPENFEKENQARGPMNVGDIQNVLNRLKKSFMRRDKMWDKAHEICELKLKSSSYPDDDSRQYSLYGVYTKANSLWRAYIEPDTSKKQMMKKLISYLMKNGLKSNRLTVSYAEDIASWGEMLEKMARLIVNDSEDILTSTSSDPDHSWVPILKDRVVWEEVGLRYSTQYVTLLWLHEINYAGPLPEMLEKSKEPVEITQSFNMTSNQWEYV